MSCSCNIVSAFPGLSGLGIISANLRSNTAIIITSESLVLIGPTIGELSVTAYAGVGEVFHCPGRAGVGYEWIQKYNCLEDKTYFIPRGGDKAFIEGDVSGNISMTTVLSSSNGINASAASGPHTVYLDSTHSDGYEFSYDGSPIGISGRDVSTGIFSSLLPSSSTLYLTNFSWQQTPPGMPTVSYSFIFSVDKT